METPKALEIMEAAAREIGADQFDILAGESQESSVQVFKGKVKETEMSSAQGIGIRIFRNNRPGYSFTRKLSEDSINNVLKMLLTSANSLQKLTTNFLLKMSSLILILNSITVILRTSPSRKCST